MPGLNKYFAPLANPEHQAEFTHAVARLTCCAIITVVLGGFVYQGLTPQIAVLISFSYLLLAAAWAFICRRSPEDVRLGRPFTVASDLIILSLLCHLLGPYGGILLPFYFLGIGSYALLAGQNYLFSGTALGVSSFSVIFATTPFWRTNPSLSVGIILSLFVLPLLILPILRQRDKATQRLGLELQKVTFAATHDAITDLANRFYFFQRVQEEIQRASRYEEKFSILYIDLDGFEQINYKHGHRFGDESLKIVADRLRSLTRKSDLIARLGGDEFALLLHDLHRTEDLRIFSQKLIEHLSLPIQLYQRDAYITASVGISLYPSHGDDPDVLINKADQAMHQSKENGKNSYTFFLEEVSR